MVIPNKISVVSQKGAGGKLAADSQHKENSKVKMKKSKMDSRRCADYLTRDFLIQIKLG